MCRTGPYVEVYDMMEQYDLEAKNGRRLRMLSEQLTKIKESDERTRLV